jgi:AcrR family transcriptional regulator
MSVAETRSRILDSALDLFGTRGVEAVSLDEIARSVGVRKQSLLYWFPSKGELVDAVLDVVSEELIAVVDAAVRSAGDEPLERIDSVIRAVFRPAVRRPALLGLVREVGRLDRVHVDRLEARLRPLLNACAGYLATEMDRGRLRRGDPGLIAALAYATVTGIATEPESLSAVGWRADVGGLRRLRDELRDFVRAALSPSNDGRDAPAAGDAPAPPRRVDR